MFDFTTQTIFNSVIIATDAQVKAKTATKGYNLITSASGKPEIRIGNTRFNQDNIEDIQISKHTAENLAKVTFDLSKLGTTEDETTTFEDGTYRIVLYIGLSMASQDSFYANDFVYKGKPLYVEFPVKASDTADTIAKRLVKIANKYMLFTAQEKILNVTEDDGTVSFEGVSGYQQIKKAILQKYDEEAKKIDCCTTDGEFVDVITGVPVMWTTNANGVVTVGNKVLDEDGPRNLADNETAIAPGIEAFCDYNWITHNLRLPTLANSYFWSVNKSEMPVVGGNYTQFTIRMKANRDGIAGQVVGQRTTSITTHVLYILDQGTNVADVTSAFATVTGAAAGTEADTKLQDPFGDLN